MISEKKTVILGVTGGIAAFKVLELIKSLQKRGIILLLS
jgi:phosphopantothenoylcysteine synthetase/decarboxylase